MGAWGYEPWETDASADWFAKVLKGVDFDAIVTTIENFDPSDEGYYEPIRCAAFVLQKLGNPYIWRVKDDEDVGGLIEQTIVHLETMIDVDETDICTFLDMWDEEPDITTSVQNQISELKLARKNWKA